MAESKSSDAKTNSVPEVRAPDMPERAKEDFDGIVHPQKSPCHHNRETHGRNDCIDENTSLNDVKAPNVFERAKEEIQALAEVFHHKKEAPTHDIRDENQKAKSKHKDEISSSPSETNAKEENFFLKARKEMKAIIHHDKSPHHHHKETHGRNDDIEENTAAGEVKGPNVLERVKEEIEAVVEAIHHKKER